jgi:hypothetical protein
VTKRVLFDVLCCLANALQAECDRLCFSPQKIVLEAIVERVDVLIDTVLEEGVHEEETPAC